MRLPARRMPPPGVLVPVGLVSGAMLLPLAYLVLRAAGAGSEIIEVVWRERTLWLLLRTAGLAGAVTAASVVIGLPLAWLTLRTDLPGRRVWSVLAALPLAIPSYVGGYTLVAALGPKGLLQQWLGEPLGLERLPSIYGFPGAFLGLTLFTYPYVFLTVRAALARLDPAQEEAARSLQSSRRRTFLRVTLPQLRPAIAAGSLLVALYTLSDFGAVSLLRFDSFTRVIYTYYRAQFDRTPAAVLACLLVLLTLAVLTVEAASRGRAGYFHQTGRALRPPRPIPLGSWRWPALAFCAAVAGVALALPAAVLGYWLLRGLAQGETLRLGFQPLVNSVLASGLAAGVTVLAALPVAYLSVRYPGRLASAAEKIAYSGYALPGIVIGLSLVFFGANFARPLYQTLAMLVFAYGVRFLPQAVGAVRSSLLQLNPRLEEAARSLGRSPWGVLRSISLPLVRPGLAAGGGMVFLTAMKELSATLLLAPIEFRTLATAVWSATEEAFFARAALPALLLVLVSALPVYWLLRSEPSASRPARSGEPRPTG